MTAFIVAFDLETQYIKETNDYPSNFLKHCFTNNPERLKYSKPWYEITQAAGICSFPKDIVVDFPTFSGWTPQALKDTKMIPNSTFMFHEMLLMEQFFEWILMNASIAKNHNQPLYLMGHNALNFDVPYIEARMLYLLETNHERRKILKRIFQNPLWNNVICIDSIALSYQYLPFMESYKLTDLHKKITGEELKEAHNAFPDTEAVLKLYDKVKSANEGELNYYGRKLVWVENFNQDWTEESYIGGGVIKPELSRRMNWVKGIFRKDCGDAEKRMRTYRIILRPETVTVVEETDEDEIVSQSRKRQRCG